MKTKPADIIGMPNGLSCINMIAPTAATNPDIAPSAGHGLGSTK